MSRHSHPFPVPQMFAQMFAYTRSDTLPPLSAHKHMHTLAEQRHIHTSPDPTHQTEPLVGRPQLLSLLQADQPASMPENYIRAVSEPPACAQHPSILSWVLPPPTPAPRALAPLIGLAAQQPEMCPSWRKTLIIYGVSDF